MNRLPAVLVPILSLLLSPRASASIKCGIEAGANYSTFDHRSEPRPSVEIESRLLPAVRVFAEHSMSNRWSLIPLFHYVQQGEKSSWQVLPFTGGSYEMLEHTLGAGMGIRYRVTRAVSLSVSPEASYLLSGKVTGTRWRVNSYPVPYEDSYADRSDRWNAVIRVGAGGNWGVGGMIGSLNVRYARGLNPQTRSFYEYLFPTERQIAWTGLQVPPYTMEIYTEAMELVAGLLW